jgi:hypothetical protein
MKELDDVGVDQRLIAVAKSDVDQGGPKKGQMIYPNSSLNT